MKGLKKLLTGILAGAMAFTMALSAGNATQVRAAENAGTITVNNAEVGTTYNFYRILDLTGKDTTNDNELDIVSYTVNSNWVAFFNGDGAKYLETVGTESKDLNVLNFNGVDKYINITDSKTDSNVVAFTNDATKYAIAHNNYAVATVEAKAETFEVGVPVLGYYLMVPEGASIENEFSNGSIASLNSTVPNATLNVKAKKPEIHKVDNVVDAEIGQNVEYTVSGKVPNTVGYDDYKYEIYDTMTAGLTYQNDAKVYVDGTEYTGATKTFDPDKNQLKVVIPVTNDYFKDKVGSAIEIKYTAKVNENAVELTQQKNKVKLVYGHKPDSTEEFEEELYSSKIVINKTGKDNVKLAGAEFVLLDKDGKAYYFNDTDANDKKVQWVSVNGISAITANTAITDDMVKAISDATGITKVVTDANGAADFKGLKNGEYYIVEFKAPLGYNRLQNARKVTINGSNVDAEGMENVAQAGQSKFDEQDNKTVDIENKTGSLLPATGGIGTTIFYIVGGILIIAGVAYFMVRRKVNAE